MYVARLAASGVSVLAMLFAGDAVAQVERSGGGVNAQLAQQYQQAVTERAKLQADDAKLKSDLDDAKKQLKAAQQQLAALKGGASAKAAALAAAEASRDSTAKSLDDTRAKTQELVGRFRETLATLKGVETDRAQLQQQLVQSKAAFDQCAVRNYELYQINGEVLDRYDHQGAFSYLARAEPFTRIKRTQIDNLVLEYRQRAEELRLKKELPPGTAAPASAGAPAGAAAGKTP